MLNNTQTDGPPISVDALDRRIIEQLKNDARQSVQMLAKNVGANRETVRYRLNRLIDKGVLTIICASNLERLGYQFMVVIGVRVRPGKIDTIASQLAGLPSVFAVALADSRYNIMAWAFVRDKSDFANFVWEDMTSVLDATSIEVMHTFHTIKLLWRPVKFELDVGNHPLYKMSNLDLAVIKAMQQNPRQSITELAKTLGCSRRVARNAFEKLIETGIIGFWPVVDPTVMGYSHWVWLLIKSEPGRMKDVANALSADDTIMTVALITGQWQVSAVALFKDSKHMSIFSSETLSTIPGIIETEAIPLGKILKFSTNFYDLM